MAKSPSKAMSQALGGKKAPAKNVAVPSCGRRDGYESVSIRPIDNGYIVSRSTDKGYSETYSATKPKIEVPVAPKAKK